MERFIRKKRKRERATRVLIINDRVMMQCKQLKMFQRVCLSVCVCKCTYRDEKRGDRETLHRDSERGRGAEGRESEPISLLLSSSFIL